MEPRTTVRFITHGITESVLLGDRVRELMNAAGLTE